MNQRQAFIRYFFQAAKTQAYALLKQFKGTAGIEEYADLDLVIPREARKAFIQLIQLGPNLQGLHIQKKSFVTYASLYFKDGSYLEIDLIHRFDRKGIIYLDAEEIIEDATESSEGVKLASLEHNFEYIVLFHLLNNAPVPVPYQQYFNNCSREDRNRIFAHMISRYKLTLQTIDELYHPQHRESKILKKALAILSHEMLPLRIFQKMRYLVDVVNDVLHNRGRVITFSGVDGSGKSTVLEKVRQELSQKYRQKTVVLRHRPSVLPILSSMKYGQRKAESLASENLPRKGSNSGSISSFLRFLYYFLDYQLGQVVVYFKYVLRGYTVLYDRYYFDFIIDARRSNIDLPQGFLKWCYHFILKPGVNVYLYAPTEVILSRKQELSESDIRQLNREYSLLFNELQQSYKAQRYIAIDNTNLNDTLREVLTQFISTEKQISFN